MSRIRLQVPTEPACGGMKKCLRCLKVLEVNNFSKNIRYADSLGIWCRRCQSSYGKNLREIRKLSPPVRPDFKTCNACKLILAAANFSSNSASPDGLVSVCRDCARPKLKNRALLRYYGITLEQRDALLALQDGKCAICAVVFSVKPKGSPRINVDHSHSSGKVRGLLCSGCNFAVGLLGDKYETALSCAGYLEKHRE